MGCPVGCRRSAQQNLLDTSTKNLANSTQPHSCMTWIGVPGYFSEGTKYKVPLSTVSHESGGVLHCTVRPTEWSTRDLTVLSPCPVSTPLGNVSSKHCQAGYQYLAASGHGRSPPRTSLPPLREGPSPADASRTLGGTEACTGVRPSPAS